MDRLQSMEEVERDLRGALRGEQLDTEAMDRIRQVLGDDASRSLREMRRLVEELEARGVVERSPEGMQLTARGMRKIGQKALGDLFARLRRDRFGEHDLARLGHGGERGDDSKPYEFGDPFDLDVQATVMNAVRREAEGHARRGRRRVAGAGHPSARRAPPRDRSRTSRPRTRGRRSPDPLLHGADARHEPLDAASRLLLRPPRRWPWLSTR